jgi:GPH family glycoside/pentoside/hexuronide:cation symporter
MDLLIIGFIIYGFGMGMVNGCRGGLIPRIVDYNEWKHGIRQDGLSYSGISIEDKIAAAVVTIFIGEILAKTGVKGEAFTQATVDGIRFIFLDLSLIFAVVSTVIFLFFNLDGKKVRIMREEINARNSSINV